MIPTIITAFFKQVNPDVPSYSRCFDKTWVQKLYRGCMRHLPQQFRFICLSDYEDLWFEEPIEIIPLSGRYRGCHHLMEAYRPDIVCKGVRIVMGLDTMIVGSLKELVQYGGHFAAPKDPYHPETICAGCLLVGPCGAARIWKAWLETENQGLWGHLPSEMVWMRNHLPFKADLIDDLYPGQVLSYKVHILAERKRPPDARVVYFHGRKKPHEIKDAYIAEHWK
jgi:hypothetical protein